MTGINVGGVGQAITPPPTVTLYGAVAGSNTTSDLYSIDSTTGTATSIGAIGFAVTGLAFRPSDGVLFGSTSPNSAADPNSIITVDPVTGAGTLVGATGLPAPLVDIAFRSDDVLYGFRSITPNRKLYTVNTSTGAATLIPSTQVPTAGGFGISFDSGDVMYLIQRDAAVYYTVDPATVALTSQGTLSGSPIAGNNNFAAAAFDDTDVLWALINAASIWLVTIDTATDVITGVGTTTAAMDALAWSA